MKKNIEINEASLHKYIGIEQFDEKTNLISFLTTSKPMILIIFGLYNYVTADPTSGPIKHILFTVVPFVLVLTLYNRSRIKKTATLSTNKTNPSFFNRLYAGAMKNASKNPQ